MYKYAFKKTVSLIVTAALTLQLGSPLAAMDPKRPGGLASVAWKFAPLLGILASAVGWKAYQYRRDKVLKETKAQLPKELQNLVGEYALPQEFKRDLIYNIKLLPAILRVQKVAFNSALEHAMKMLHDNREALINAPEFSALRNYLEADSKASHNQRAIALHATIMAPHDVALHAPAPVQHLNLLQQQHQNPHDLLIKDETELHTILGAPLLPGQVALVSYSDGDLRIELADSDRQILDGFNEKQRKFLDSLYATQRVIDNGHPTMHFGATEYVRFSRLFDRGQISCIREFYTIQYSHELTDIMVPSLALGAAICWVVWLGSRIGKVNSSEYWDLWSKLWDANNENALLKNQLRTHSIPLPEGAKPASSMKVGNINITF